MTIDPSQLRRLLIRVCVVTIAMRAVSMFSVDVSAAEAATLLGLSPDGAAGSLVAAFMSAWGGLAAGIRGVVRTPMVLCDVALVLLALSWTRISGWGSLAGLLTGMVLAMAPFGLDEGWRADGTALISVLALAPLVMLRLGLRDGALPVIAGSAVVLTIGGVLSPMVLLVLPVGLLLGARSVTGTAGRITALAGWLLAVVAALGVRWLWLGDMGPQVSLAGAWLADATLNGGRQVLPDSPLLAFGEGLAALSAGGPTGGVSSWLEIHPAPMWRIVLGLCLWPLAAWGFWSGRVQPDRPPETAAVSESEGAGAVDGWRALGVGGITLARELGERDWLPLLSGVLAAAGWLAWAAVDGRPHGVDQALAVGRPLAALLLGVGLTGFAGRAGFATGPARKHFVVTMVASALLIFALGAHHFYLGTQSLDRISASKVARYGGEEIAGKGRMLCLGPSGLAISWMLDPMSAYPRIERSAADIRLASAALKATLTDGPSPLVLAGDRQPLEGRVVAGKTQGQGPLGAALHGQLNEAGYDLLEDGHRYLAGVAIRVYEKPHRSPGTIIPQLYPGKAP